MALRKHQRTSEQKAVHTGDGHVIRRGLGAMLPPPDFPCIAWGPYWAGPLILTAVGVGGGFSTKRTISLDFETLEFHPMFEGME